MKNTLERCVRVNSFFFFLLLSWCVFVGYCNSLKRRSWIRARKHFRLERITLTYLLISLETVFCLLQLKLDPFRVVHKPFFQQINKWNRIQRRWAIQSEVLSNVCTLSWGFYSVNTGREGYEHHSVYGVFTLYISSRARQLCQIKCSPINNWSFTTVLIFGSSHGSRLNVYPMRKHTHTAKINSWFCILCKKWIRSRKCIFCVHFNAVSLELLESTSIPRPKIDDFISAPVFHWQNREHL